MVCWRWAGGISYTLPAKASPVKALPAIWGTFKFKHCEICSGVVKKEQGLKEEPDLSPKEEASPDLSPEEEAPPDLSPEEEVPPDLSPEEEAPPDLSPEEDPLDLLEDPPGLSPDLSPAEEGVVETSRDDLVLTPTDDSPAEEPVLSHLQQVIQGQSTLQRAAAQAQEVIATAQELAAADLAYRYTASTSSVTWPTTVAARERLAKATAKAKPLVGQPGIRLGVPDTLRNLMSDSPTADTPMPAMAAPAMAAAAGAANPQDHGAANPQDHGERPPVIYDGKDRCASDTSNATGRNKTLKKRARLKVMLVGSPEHLAAVAKAKAAEKPRDAANSWQQRAERMAAQQQAAGSRSSSSHETAQPSAAAAASAGDRIN